MKSKNIIKKKKALYKKVKKNKINKKEICENLFDTYKTVDSIHDRLDVLIRLEMKNGDFTESEEFEFVELKRLRSIIDPKYKFFK